MSSYETLLCAVSSAQERQHLNMPVNVLDLAEVLAELAALRGAAPSACKYPAEFEEAWALYPPRVGKNKVATFKQWKARIKAGASVVAMLEGTAKYAAYCKAERTEERFIKQPATFFGPDQHFAADWTVRRALAGASSDLVAAAMQNRRGGPPDDFQGVTIDV